MLYEQNYLAHYGVKGQRWGVRRFQNEDGTLTSAGKERYSKDNQDAGDSSDRSTSQVKKDYIGSEPKTKLFIKEVFDWNFKRERKAWEIRKTIASKNLHERISKDDSRKLAKFKRNVVNKVLSKMEKNPKLAFKSALWRARVELFVQSIATAMLVSHAMSLIRKRSDSYFDSSSYKRNSRTRIKELPPSTIKAVPLSSDEFKIR